MNESVAPDGPSLRAHAFLWIAVAYLSALGVGLIAGIAELGRHPIEIAWIADVAATLAIFAFSFAFGNSSFYDAYWSVAPVPIAVYWLFASDPAGGVAVPERQLLVLAVLLLWAVRLTANWARGWEGLSHEDWRYVDIRAKTGPFYWPASNPPPAASCGQGLWAWSRHPNDLGEILVWVSMALFGLAAGGFVWWAWVGVAAMLAMFLLVSIPLKETRMLARRPAYAERQRRVSLLVPRPPRRA